MIPSVHEDEDHRGRPRYTLTETEHGHAWGVCAEAEGLFGEPQRGTYELFGWVPQAEVHGWVGNRVWLVPDDPLNCSDRRVRELLGDAQQQSSRQQASHRCPAGQLLQVRSAQPVSGSVVQGVERRPGQPVAVLSQALGDIPGVVAAVRLDRLDGQCEREGRDPPVGVAGPLPAEYRSLGQR